MDGIKLNGMTPGYMLRFDARTGETTTVRRMRVNVDSLVGRDLFVQPKYFFGGFLTYIHNLRTFPRVPSGTAQGNKTFFFDKQPMFAGRLAKNGPVDPRQTGYVDPTFSKFVKSQRFMVRY